MTPSNENDAVELTKYEAEMAKYEAKRAKFDADSTTGKVSGGTIPRPRRLNHDAGPTAMMKRGARKLAAKDPKLPVVRAPATRPTQKEHKPERITAWANASAAIAGAVTAVFVSVKVAIEVVAALKTEATLKAAAVFAGRVMPWRSLLFILISLAVSLLNEANGLTGWGEPESLALIIQIASA